MNIQNLLKSVFGNTNTKNKNAPIVLTLSDQHSDFGAVSVARIKQILAEQEFEDLMSLYFLMTRDLKVSSSIQSRKQQLLSLNYTITSENEAFAEWVNQIDWDQLIIQLVNSIYYGIGIVDVSYAIEEQKLVPTLRQISPRFLHSKKQTELKTTEEHYYLKQNGEELFLSGFEPHRLIIHKHPIDIGEITDYSLAFKLTWYFTLKHIVMSHHLTFFDAVATPPLIAKTDEDEDTLLTNLKILKSQSVGVFGKEDDLEYLNVSTKADFLQSIEYYDRQIAQMILSNTLATGEGSTGSFSQAQVHQNRQHEVRAYDAKLINKTITKYLNQLEKLNFPNPKGCSFRFDTKPPVNQLELSQVVKNLSSAGWEADPEELKRRFNLTLTRAKPNTTQQAPSKAKNAQAKNNNSCKECNITSTNEDHVDSQQPATQAIAQHLLNAVDTAIKDTSNYQQAFDALLQAYPDFDTNALTTELEKRIANSRIYADSLIGDD